MLSVTILICTQYITINNGFFSNNEDRLNNDTNYTNITDMVLKGLK